VVTERERRLMEVRETTYQRVRESLMRRLGPVCSHMQPHEFDELVHRAAEIQIKYEVRRAHALPPER
jgi:hypothetical protein